MRRRLALTLVLGSTLAGIVAIAPAAIYVPVCLRRPSPTTAASDLCPPLLEFDLAGGIAPKKLPKTEMAPVAINFRSKVHYADGTQPPALEEVTIDFDRNGAIDVTGIPACRRGQLKTQGPSAARRTCRKSIVGTGIAHVGIGASERGPIPLPLTLFNGGAKDGTTTLFIQSSLAAPTPTPIVATVKLKRARKSRFGLQATATIPRLATGQGSILDFRFKVKRLWEYKGMKRSYAKARCLDGHLYARMTNAFADGTQLAGTLMRPCDSTG